MPNLSSKKGKRIIKKEKENKPCPTRNTKSMSETCANTLNPNNKKM